MDVLLVFAYLNYALLEFIIAELIGYIIEKKTLFEITEFFVFLTIGVGLMIFFFSNIFQEFIINKMRLLGGWLILIFVFVLSLNILFLAKFLKKRTWKFRLVIIPLVILIIIIIAVVTYFIITLTHPSQLAETTSNITGISP